MATITEYAILVFKSPPDFSDPTPLSLFRKLSAWQSECSGFPLLFFTNPNDPLEVHLVTGWASVAAHEAWIRGERNQELLRVFAPYVDMQKIRMVHLGMDFEAIPKDVGCIVVERHDGQLGGKSTRFEWEIQGSDRSRWSLTGRDLARGEVCRSTAPVERWVLRRVEL